MGLWIWGKAQFDRLWRVIATAGVRMLTVLLFSLGLILIWTWIFYQISLGEQLVRVSVAQNLQNVGKSFKEEFESIIETTDQTLKAIKYQYELNPVFDRKKLDSWLTNDIFNMSRFNQVGIIDRQGTYIYSNLKNQKRINLSDREHFKIHKTGYPYPIFISKPLMGRASNKWSLQFSHKLVNKSGDFNGVAVASLNPQVINDYFNKIDLGKQGVIALVGEDGAVRAIKLNERTVTDNSITQINVSDVLTTNFRSTFSTDRLLDGTSRLYSMEHINNQPLWVLVGQSQSEASNEWSSVRLSLINLGAVLSIGLALMVFVLGRLMRSDSLLKKRQLMLEQSLWKVKTERTSSLNRLDKDISEKLKGVSDSAQFLQTQSREEMSHLAAATILDNIQSILNTFNKIRIIQSLRFSEVELAPEVVPLKDWLMSFLAQYEGGAVKPHLTIDLKALPEVAIDTEKLSIVLKIILDNALRFSDSGMIVELIASTDDQRRQLTIEVQDRGLGMTKGLQKQLRKKIGLEESSEWDIYEGKGLHLLLASLYLKTMGGELHFQSQVGSGTQMRLTVKIGD